MHLLLLLTICATTAEWRGWEDYSKRYPLVLHERKGKTYYVRREKGDDFSEGTSRTSAFRSIKRACEVAEPGDTVIVGKGDYVEQLSPTNGGRFPDATILFYADVDGAFTGDPGLVRILGELNAPVLLDQATGIELIGFQIVARVPLPKKKDSPQFLEFVGVEMIDSSAVLRCCEITGAETGIHAKRSLLRIDECQVRGASKSAILSDNSRCMVVGGRLRDNVGSAVLARVVEWKISKLDENPEKPIQPLRELAKKEYSIQLQRCQLDNNRGGGVSTQGVPAEVDGCLIQNNGNDAIQADEVQSLAIRDTIAFMNLGRGCAASGGKLVTVERSVFRGNLEWGIETKGPDLKLTNGLIVDNGQGISIGSTGRLNQASIWHATIANNRGQFLVSSDNTKPGRSLRDNRFGVLLQGGELELVNSIVAGNGQFGMHRYSGILKHHHNLVSGQEENFFGTKIDDFEVVAEPRFTDAANGNYELSRNSRAINRALDPKERAAVDLVGIARIMHRRADLGCYEFKYEPGVRSILNWEEVRSDTSVGNWKLENGK